MITITVNAENGAVARKELIDLLGLNAIGNLTATLGGNDTSISFVTERPKKDVTVGDGEHTFEELKKEEASEPEKKKRRTKAEIEAEAAKANTGSEEPPATEVKPEEPEVKADEFPTLRDVQILSGTLVRAGYKDKAIELVKTVGKAESTPAVAEENRQALIDAFKQLAADNKIALPE